MIFQLLSEIAAIEVIARGSSVRRRAVLRTRFGRGALVVGPWLLKQANVVAGLQPATQMQPLSWRVFSARLKTRSVARARKTVDYSCCLPIFWFSNQKPETRNLSLPVPVLVDPWGRW